MTPDKASQRRRSLVRELVKNGPFRALVLRLAAARLLGRGPRARFDLACYPTVPNHKEIMWKVALLAGIGLAAHGGGTVPAAGRRPQVGVIWGGVRRAPPVSLLPVALNRRLRDTSKSQVGRIFAETFGYALAVDPTTHAGDCVAKSDGNAAHDGRVIRCPIAVADPGLSYQRLVDNRTDDGAVLDFRVPVLGGEIPFVYLKYRPLEGRFRNVNGRVALAETAAVLSAAEQQGIRTFCHAIGLDLGELDVLRDRGDGRIYIVDVNGRPFGPPKPIATGDAVRAVQAYAAAFVGLAERVLAAEAGPAGAPPARPDGRAAAAPRP
ncbi:MAG: hypothetical protein U1E14_04375 [Geminicoccaceae bacterium]